MFLKLFTGTVIGLFIRDTNIIDFSKSYVALAFRACGKINLNIIKSVYIHWALSVYLIVTHI